MAAPLRSTTVAITSRPKMSELAGSSLAGRFIFPVSRLRQAAFRQAVLIGVGLVAMSACGSEELEGAKAEVVETSIKLDLPAVPDFEMPSPNDDGTHPVNEMRLVGTSLLDSEITVTGTVLWIYNCADTIRTPGMTDKEVQKIIDAHPTRCNKPMFVIGEEADTNIRRGVQVVENPRPIRKDQKKTRNRDELAAMQAAYDAMPAFKVGDEVAVTGPWVVQSPGNFKNSSGLLVYKSMINKSAPAPEPKKKRHH